MTSIKEIKRGNKLTLTFKEGEINQQGVVTIVAKSPCGRFAVLSYNSPTSKQVVVGSVWECSVEFTFTKKIVVIPITLISEPQRVKTTSPDENA